MNQDPSTNITYASLHLVTEHGVLHPCRWSFLCAPDTSDKQVSAYSTLQDSTKIAQVMLSIFLSLVMTGAELPPPFWHASRCSENASPSAQHKGQEPLNGV